MTADPGRALAGALRSLSLGAFRGAVSAELLASRPWASCSVSGARHRLSLRLEGQGARDAAAELLGSLVRREFVLRGHIVADIAAVAVREDLENRLCLTLEALTVPAD